MTRRKGDRRGSLVACLFGLWFTGLLGIGFEVLAIRALSQVLENTVYSFSTALAVYLLGTASGAAFYQRWDGRNGPPTFSRLLTLLSLGCLAGCTALCFSTPLYNTIREVLGDGIWASKLRLDQPLIIAEMIRRGVLADLSPELLAGIIAVFVNDKYRDIEVNRSIVWDRRELYLHYYRIKDTIGDVIAKLKKEYLIWLTIFLKNCGDLSQV